MMISFLLNQQMTNMKRENEGKETLCTQEATPSEIGANKKIMGCTGA